MFRSYFRRTKPPMAGTGVGRIGNDWRKKGLHRCKPVVYNELELAKGIEPPTRCLQGSCSTD